MLIFELWIQRNLLEEVPLSVGDHLFNVIRAVRTTRIRRAEAIATPSVLVGVGHGAVAELEVVAGAQRRGRTALELIELRGRKEILVVEVIKNSKNHMQ